MVIYEDLRVMETIAQNIEPCWHGYWMLELLQIFWFLHLPRLVPVFLGDYVRNINITLYEKESTYLKWNLLLGYITGVN